MKLINLVKNHQEKVVLSIGFVFVAALSFGLGRVSAVKLTPPEIRIEEVFSPPLNNTQKNSETQSEDSQKTSQNASNSCEGKIKGNISAKGDKIYHIPKGAFYARTVAELCFSTEAEALAAGFRKSSK
jgi:hypothetical protein